MAAPSQDGKKRTSVGEKKKVKRRAQAPPAVEAPELAEDSEPETAPEAPARKTKARRLEEMQAASEKVKGNREPRGVIYLGHIPNGFFEPQMRKFFGQFGKLTRLRLSRSKKNAQSKGYAHVEFEEEEVAKIVANTMDKYLLFGKQLVCHIVPKEKQHPALWKGCRSQMKNMTNVRRKKARVRHNDRPSVEVNGQELPQTTVRQVKTRGIAQKKLKAMLLAAGVDYDLDAVAAGGGDGPDIEEVKRVTKSSNSPKVTAQEPKKKKQKVAHKKA